MTLKFIAITGGIGSGKSYVAKMLSGSMPARLIDTDFLARDVVRPGTALHDEIFWTFHADPSTPEGRAKLRTEIMPNPDQREYLESKIFPAVAERVWAERMRFQREGAQLALCESALFGDPRLLVRHACLRDFKYLFDAHIYVEADLDVRIRRIVARGLTEDAAKAMIEAQKHVFPIPWAGPGHVVRSADESPMGNDRLRVRLREIQDALKVRTP